MQIKTIKKTIVSKMEEWLATITDETLRADLKKNILVTGGSITSMLLNEPVNDFDVYIKDMGVLMRVASYYTNDFGIEILDGRKKEELVAKIESDYYKNPEVKTVDDINSIRAINIRNLKADQVKLFLTTGGMRVNEDKSAITEGVRPTYFPIFFSPNAISLSDDVQIVLRFHGDNEQIHKTFDFIHATNYFTFEDGLVTNIDALQCILTKQLKYQGSLYPLTSIIRVKKFIKRGWNINAGEMLKMMFQVSELNLSDPNVLEEQLIGIDVAYFGKLIEILRGVPQEKINSSYLSSIIDKVFSDADEEI